MIRARVMGILSCRPQCQSFGGKDSMSTKKNFWIGLPMQMMYGLVLGVIVGTMVSSEFGATYLQPLGQLFIRLIRMVVVPLVVATLIAGSAGLGDASKIGKIAVKNNSLLRNYDGYCSYDRSDRC